MRRDSASLGNNAEGKYPLLYAIRFCAMLLVFDFPGYAAFVACAILAYSG